MVQLTENEMSEKECPRDECTEIYESSRKTPASLGTTGVTPFDNVRAVVTWCSGCGYVWDVGVELQE